METIKITVYTDPLCAWTYAMHSALESLRSLDSIGQIHYKMTGMLPSWRRLAKSGGLITNPSQLAEEWSFARRTAKIKIDETILINNLPASSYPASIAIKAAQIQGLESGSKFLLLIQAGVMLEGLDIGQNSVIDTIAKRVDAFGGFDLDRFRRDVVGQAARDEFWKDIEEWQCLELPKTPAISLKNTNGKGILLTGYQKAVQLKRAARGLLE